MTHTMRALPSSFVLRCVEKNMKKNSFLEQVGHTVVALCRNIPRGVLVFLPSYALLRQVGLLWRESEVRGGGSGLLASTPRYVFISLFVTLRRSLIRTRVSGTIFFSPKYRIRFNSILMGKRSLYFDLSVVYSVGINQASLLRPAGDSHPRLLRPR